MWRTRLILLGVLVVFGGCNFATGSANLSWSAVSQDKDGVPLKDLAGYKIYYGTSPQSLQQVFLVSDPHQTSCQIGHLARGTWYFSVVAYTKSGAEGSASNVTSKTIR
jgi:hypothetical protein